MKANDSKNMISLKKINNYLEKKNEIMNKAIMISF